MGGAGRAVVDALVAEAAAVASAHRPDEVFGETGTGVVTGAGSGDRGTFAGDPRGNFRRRGHRAARQAVHPLDREVTCGHGDLGGFVAAIGASDLHADRRTEEHTYE